MERRAHWNTVFATKSERQMSWFEAVPVVSLELMDAAGLSATTSVLDVGGGDSHLVDALMARGLSCVTVLDISGAALRRAADRLGTRAAIPRWIETDVTDDWTVEPVQIWHDRAVFHFLTDPTDRARYVEHLRRALKPGGTAIVATFAHDGPTMCSGLPVVRYDPATLVEALGGDFVLLETRRHMHSTPWGMTQSFQYCRLRRPDSTGTVRV